MSDVSRRDFLRFAAAVPAGFAGLQAVFPERAVAGELGRQAGYGPLVPDTQGLLDLPKGFSYTIISRQGETMDDGLLVPGLHDGMAAFTGPNGTTILLRNHEIGPLWTKVGGFGERNELLSKIDPSKMYDMGHAKRPCLGGVSRVIYDTRSRTLISHEMALAGTNLNCAGGATPWGSWVTCEECTDRAGDLFEKDHGYNFEVPADGKGLVTPRPIKAMGRFKHEAIAVDPATGIVYQTEDTGDGLIYRYIPNEPGNLIAGGRLQALAIVGRPSLDTRNWQETTVNQGETLPVHWLDLDDIDAPKDDLRYRGFKAGAARFARGEGMHWGNDAVYIAATNGGPIFKGQIWRYRPSPHEGASRENESPGTLELWIEPNDGTIIENADNLCIAPWGDVFICEDGPEDDYLLRINPQGEIYRFARNTRTTDELAGSCFSPDGTVLFFNIQQLGITLAVTGPWDA